MEQDKAALQTNKKTAKRRKWVILLCVLAVLLIFCAYSLWVSSRSLSSYDFIRVFNADDTLGGLRFPTYDEDFTVTKQEDLTCLGVRLEGSDMHYALLYCDPESEKVRYVVILELATERDLPSLLPFIAVQLNHIAYPLQFYRDRALRETLAPFCAGDVDMIGYTEPSPNHICYALVTQDSEEDPKMFLRTFVFEMPHDGERKSFSYFYSEYPRVNERINAAAAAQNDG